MNFILFHNNKGDAAKHWSRRTFQGSAWHKLAASQHRVPASLVSAPDNSQGREVHRAAHELQKNADRG